MTNDTITTAHDDDTPDGLRGGAWPVGENARNIVELFHVLCEARAAAGEYEMAACPFCGNDEPYSNDPGPMYSVDMLEITGYVGECDKCSAMGPTAPTFREAVDLWNVRPTPPVGAA